MSPLRWISRIVPWIAGAAMLAALTLIFLVVPTERVQGIVQRIFYIHLPCAWTAFVAFGTVAIASAIFLWRGSRAADQLAYASAEVGMIFCTLVLMTGPIWARPIWGVWWTWDPRLTMTIILWSLYAGYLMLRSFGGRDDQTARFAAVLGIVAALDIPLIVVSVRLWRGIHPAVLGRNSPNAGLADPRMGLTLAVAAVACLLLFVWLVTVRWRVLRVRAGLDELHFERNPA